MLAAGATEVYPSFRGAPIVRSRRDLAADARLVRGHCGERDDRPSVLDRADGRGPRRAAADSFGLVHGADNVYVNDASLLPDAPGVNPQASVMAIAVRNAGGSRRRHR